MPKIPTKPAPKMTGGAGGATGRIEKSALAGKPGKVRGSLRK